MDPARSARSLRAYVRPGRRGIRRFGEPRPRLWVPALVIVVLAVGAGLARTVAAGPVVGAPPASAPPIIPPYSIVNYTSSVDGWNLSYEEWLPAGYDPAQAYPLAVYLHGLEGDNPVWYDGGATSELLNKSWGPPFIQAAESDGYLLIALNTRTVDGFYVNSPYTGPAEQDTLDAIAHERALRLVSSVYLFGESMGSVGSLDLVVHHPGMFAGVGAIADCADMYESLEWRVVINDTLSIEGTLGPTGGQWPNQTAWADGVYYYMSAFRFFPGNLSGVRAYFSVGGNDSLCPNNPHLYSFEQGNDTVLTTSCVAATNLSEPASCTTPLSVLDERDSGAYPWRYDYVAAGGHTGGLPDPNDMFEFWSGHESVGLVCSSPSSPPTNCTEVPTSSSNTSAASFPLVWLGIGGVAVLATVGVGVLVSRGRRPQSE